MDTPDTLADGEGQRAAELLPAVYAELRRLASVLTGRLPPGQILQPTALVHEAYLRLAGGDRAWEDQRHFFSAAQAMRHILIDQARRKGSTKHGGGGHWIHPRKRGRIYLLCREKSRCVLAPGKLGKGG